MDIQTEKEFIKAELDKTDDIHLVEAIKNMLNYGKAMRYESGLKPMDLKEFYARNAESRKAIEKNDLVSQDDVEKYFREKRDR